jgi:hypothetical protein
MNSIIYTTDNSLDEQLAQTCQRVLLHEAGNLPLSVSAEAHRLRDERLPW